MADGWAAIHHAAARSDLDAALRAFYADLDAEVARGDARCDQSGRCCHFDAFGHRLYVTALEVAWFVRRAGSQVSSLKPQDARNVALPQLETPTFSPACPYQQNNRCTTHTIRPMGCRVFFCQRGTEAWQHDLYERFLDRLKTLHTDHGVPYRYVEWRAGLAEALATAPPSPAT